MQSECGLQPWREAVKCKPAHYAASFYKALQAMLRLLTLSTAVLGALALAACSPAFNWREVRPDNTRLSFLLPCKPDKAEKVVPLGGQPTTLAMLGCDAGGATFAVAVADLGNTQSAASAAPVLARWQQLTLDNMQADPATLAHLALKVPGSAGEPPVVRVQAQGRRVDGSAVTGQAAYFAQGTQVFQVVMYAAKPNLEVADTFFSSLKFD